MLKVGRAMQPPDFWSTLVPAECLRKISREHFEIRQGMLRNLSATGTLLNGLPVEEHFLAPGDLVAIPELVEFRVELDVLEERLCKVASPQRSRDVVRLPSLPAPFSLECNGCCLAASSKEASLTVGKELCKDLCKELGATWGLAPKHFTVALVDGSLLLEAFAPITLNGHAVTKSRLCHGDCVEVPGTELSFRSSAETLRLRLQVLKS